MVLFEDVLNVVRREFCLTVVRVWVVQDSSDLKVRFGHRETGVFNLKGVNVVRVFNVLVNDGYVRLLSNLVDYD